MRSVKIVIMVTAVSIPQTNVNYLTQNSDTSPDSHIPVVSRRVSGESLSKKPNPIAELNKLFTEYNINFSSDKPNSPEDLFNILSHLSSSFQNLSKEQKLTLRSKLKITLLSILTEKLDFPSDIAQKEVTRVINRILKGPEAVNRFKNALMKVEGAPEQFMNTFNEVSNKLAVLPKVNLANNKSTSEESSYNNSLGA